MIGIVSFYYYFSWVGFKEREEWGRERKRNKHQCVTVLAFALTGWCLDVSRPRIEPMTSVYQDDALTH